MKKNLLLTLLLILMSVCPLQVCAQNISSPLITYGITDDGINYEVYGEILAITENSITVTRNIIYAGNVTPSITLSWTETIDGSTYSGTLRLTGSVYNASTNQTTATYNGTLYKK